MNLDYLLLDVFTSERLRGNQLAVVAPADGLLDDQMQAIAREFNLSETVFITRPRSERHSAALRIFTPLVELPFAGHPTVGAAVALGLETRGSVLRLEEKVGVVTCIVDNLNRHCGFARFTLPVLPEVAGSAPAPEAAAAALGIAPAEIGCGVHAMAVYSAGVPFYLVPVQSPAVLRRVQPQTAAWPAAFPAGQGSVYTFTETPDEPANRFAARMFSPGMGIIEDPATGSAAAALIGLLARNGMDGQYEYALRQGLEMGRPSCIMLQYRRQEGELTHASIGGHAIVVGKGQLLLGE